MEASEGNVRGVIDTLTKVVEALDRAGIELIGENKASHEGGRGVRLKRARNQAAGLTDDALAPGTGLRRALHAEARHRFA